MTVVPFPNPESWNARSRDELAVSFREAIIDHFRAHTVGTNISAATLLTTDYLDQFNEAVRLLEALPATPGEVAPDLEGWKARSYEEHFAAPDQDDKSFALAAYEHAPPAVREVFDDAVAGLQEDMARALREAAKAAAAGDAAELDALCERWVPDLEGRIQEIATLVSGDAEPVPFDEGA